MNFEVDIFALRCSFIKSTIMTEKSEFGNITVSNKLQILYIFICINVFLRYDMVTSGVIKLDTSTEAAPGLMLLALLANRLQHFVYNLT